MAGLVTFVVLGWLALGSVAERTALYPAPPAGDGERELAASGGTRLWLDAAGAKIEAWLLPPTGGGDGPHPLLLFTHGNGELIDHWAGAFDEARADGFAVLLVEYPGYGRSGGAPSEATVRETVLAAYDAAAADPSVDPKRIVAWGRSLGGGAAGILSRERPLAGLVLESTFTNVPDVAARLGVPTSMLDDRYDTLDAVARYEGPVLILHGEKDKLIPVSHAHRLHEAAKGSRLVVLDCGHNDCAVEWDAVRGGLGAR